MSSGNESEASTASTRTSASGWGVEDDEVGWTGVHLRVLGGRPVWPLAFNLFVMAVDCRAFVARCMECCDFVPAWCRSGSAVARLVEEILAGRSDWASARVSAAEADCVLAALGLLHMKVKCVIPEELGGEYEPAVRVRVPGTCALICN
jgi:hypothetical protein